MPRSIAEPPVLSLAERDRRWTRIRGLLREHGLDGVLLAGFRAREMYESYASDDYNEGCVVFPLEGDPTVITWAPLRVMRARYSAERGHKLWIDDYRVATSGAGVAEVIREKRLGEGRLGVVGLRSQAPTEIYGAIPANFWLELTAALPAARFEDISEEFSHLMLVKSAEEMAQVRYAAKAAEAACKVIAEVTEPGVGEEVVFAEATREMLRFGIGLRYPMIVMNSGPHTLSWGPPRWSTRGEAPRVLARGDLMQAELMPLCGNQEVQVQMTVALDPLDDTNRQCERVARASYEAGIKAMKPGISFAELVVAMAEPLKSAGCWAYTPLVHSLGPHFLAGRPGVNMEKVDLGVRMAGAPAVRERKAVLQPGMVFAFEPNACLGQHRVNIGGTVIVTETGCEELNHIPTGVTHKQ
ncbi:MAG TPA: M24 family metallopeptidase [Stellaceae bacterium]|nr:M24 family metallopeptidase [Stellaceae bacterium]